MLERARAWAEEAGRTNVDGVVEIVPGRWDWMRTGERRWGAHEETKQHTVKSRIALPLPKLNSHTGYWQHVLPTLGRKFDAVLLDDFPLPLDDEEDHSSGSGSDNDNGGDDRARRQQQRRQAQRDECRILAAAGSRWHAFLDLVVR